MPGAARLCRDRPARADAGELQSVGFEIELVLAHGSALLLSWVGLECRGCGLLMHAPSPASGGGLGRGNDLPLRVCDGPLPSPPRKRGRGPSACAALLHAATSSHYPRSPAPGPPSRRRARGSWPDRTASPARRATRAARSPCPRRAGRPAACRSPTTLRQMS